MSAVLVSLTCLLASTTLVTAAGNIHSRSGFRLTWADDFATPDSIAQNWQIDTGNSYPGGPANWGTGEIQRYTSSPANLFVSSEGLLNIVPRKWSSRTGAVGWTSARIESKRADFQCRNGGQMWIESSIYLPPGQEQDGMWAAFWAMGGSFRGNGNKGWPRTGEWDIMESVNGQNTVHGTVHCGVLPGGPCNEPSGLSGTAMIQRETFNVFSLLVDRTNSDWRGEFLAWFVNGSEYSRVYGWQIGDFETWKALVHEPFFILFNVAVGGAFPNALAARDTPTVVTRDGYGMAVDWVAVFNN